MNKLYDVVITFVVGHAQIKTYKYQVTDKCLPSKIMWALQQSNLYSCEVIGADTHVLYVREELDERPDMIKRVVMGNGGSITWIPVPTFALPTQELPKASMPEGYLEDLAWRDLYVS